MNIFLINKEKKLLWIGLIVTQTPDLAQFDKSHLDMRKCVGNG